MSVKGPLSRQGVKQRRGTMLPTHFVFVTLVAIVAISAGSAAYLFSAQSQASPQSAGVSVGGVQFGSQWRYASNVTLTGSQSACEILRFPCPSALPQSEAERILSSNGTMAYVETASGCGPGTCVSWTIVLIGNSLYCVTPRSNIQSQPLCPIPIT